MAAAVPLWPETQNLFVGAGFIPPAEPCGGAWSGGMRASRPTSARWGAAVPVWPETQNLFVGAGFIPPAKPCGGAWPPGPMRASSPTGVTAMRGSRLTAVFPRLCRAGVLARRTAAIQNRGVRGGGRPGGMRASRPTSARWGAAVPVWPETQNLFVGAGFIPPAKPCGGAWPPGRCKHRPLQGFVVWQGRNFPVGRGARRRS